MTQTIFATSRVATAAVAALVQGFDAVEAFQSAHVFPGTGLEGLLTPRTGRRAARFFPN
jgi:hypothetical protein